MCESFEEEGGREGERSSKASEFAEGQKMRHERSELVTERDAAGPCAMDEDAVSYAMHSEYMVSTLSDT